MKELNSSAVYVRGLCRAVTVLGKESEVRARGGPLVAQLFDAPSSRSWWGPQEVDALVDAMGAEGGTPLVTEVGRVVMKEVVSGVVQPFLAVVLAVGRATPATIFSRMGQFSSMAVRNVRFEWEPKNEQAGVLVIEYPAPVSSFYGDLWHGPFEYVYEVTRRQGLPTTFVHQRGLFRFDVSWR